jgi:hypothetical protein
MKWLQPRTAFFCKNHALFLAMHRLALKRLVILNPLQLRISLQYFDRFREVCDPLFRINIRH